MKLIALPPKHSVSHHVEMLGAGLPLTIVNPSIFHGYKDSLDSLIESVRLLVPEQIDNQGCLGFEVHYGRQHRVVRIWIGEKDHLPRRMDLTLQQERRADIIENWSEIAVGNSVAPDLFRWQPPESWTEWSVPHIDSGLLPVGADAPEFELASTDGSKIRLSDYRGKHVLLFHWRLGCPPCIEEIPILEKLFVKHHSAGLVVLGINTTDRKAEVLQTLRKNQVTFRNAANASADAVVVMEKFETVRGLGAVPMTYMISPDGKVLSAWYGCDRQKLERSLFDAGFRGSEAEGG